MGDHGSLQQFRSCSYSDKCSPPGSHQSIAGLNVMPRGIRNKSQSGPSKVWFLATEWELTLPTPWPGRLLLLCPGVDPSYCLGLAVKHASLTRCEEVSQLQLLNNVVTQSKLGTGKPVSKEPGAGEPPVWKAVQSHRKEGLLLLSQYPGFLELSALLCLCNDSGFCRCLKSSQYALC